MQPKHHMNLIRTRSWGRCGESGAAARRLEQLMDRHTARKGEIDTRLADPDIYAEARKDELKQLLFEQADLVRELDQLEGEWMEQQEALESLAS